MKFSQCSVTKKEIKSVLYLYITDGKCTEKNLNQLLNCDFLLYFFTLNILSKCTPLILL